MGVGFARCGGCHERILWARTEKQKSQALNPQPTVNGNVAVYRSPETDIYHARTVSDAEPVMRSEKLYMPHAATCSARPKPKTTLVTPKNRAQVARRVAPTVPVQLGLDVELPPNVIRMDTRRGES